MKLRYRRHSGVRMERTLVAVNNKKRTTRVAKAVRQPQNTTRESRAQTVASPDDEDGGVELHEEDAARSLTGGYSKGKAAIVARWATAERDSIAASPVVDVPADAMLADPNKHDARTDKWFASIISHWSPYWLNHISKRLRPPFMDSNEVQSGRGMSRALLKSLAIMSYWIQDPRDADELLVKQVKARLSDYYHGNKARHMTPADVQCVLMRLTAEDGLRLAGKTWADLANEALRGASQEFRETGGR